MDGGDEKDLGILCRESMNGLSNETLTADGMVFIMDALIGETAGRKNKLD